MRGPWLLTLTLGAVGAFRVPPSSTSASRRAAAGPLLDHASPRQQRTALRSEPENAASLQQQEERVVDEPFASGARLATEEASQGAVVVVDPFSSGATIAKLAGSMGYEVVHVYSDDNHAMAGPKGLKASGESLAAVQHDARNANEEEALEATLSKLKALDVPIVAVIPGAESAVELADKLSACCGTRGNSLALTEARRHKFHMHEAVRAKGVRACMQRECFSEEQLRDFMASVPEGTNVVLKPPKSVGSDNVFRCNGLDEALAAYKEIRGTKNYLGLVSPSALVQEYLEGTEYVVDSVSRDGVHKAVAIWEYDKRDANGLPFQYFGMEMRAADNPGIRSLVDYAHSVLDALEIRQGASHLEVKMTPTGPCLVEVGARCHGGGGTWHAIAKECVGYTQLEEVLNVYLGPPEKFDGLPKAPESLKKYGAEVFLVSQQTGCVVAIPGEPHVRNLASFRSLQLNTEPGARCVITIDCFSRPGATQLVHESKEQLDADVRTIRRMEEEGTFFELEK